MTTTTTNQPTDRTLPACPHWCTTPGHDWDSYDNRGRRVRCHDGPRFGPEVSIGSTEYDDGTVEDFGVYISLPEETVVRPAAQAREMAILPLGRGRVAGDKGMSTTTAASTERPTDEREETADAELRHQLKLRPIYYPANGDGQHADRRPCPSWCWVGLSVGEYDHEVDADTPMVAAHHMDTYPNVVASLYPGDFGFGEDRIVQVATLEPRLEQTGQADPTIRVALRYWNGRKPMYDDVRLRLTITDARELVTALTYLIETVNA